MEKEETGRKEGKTLLCKFKVTLFRDQCLCDRFDLAKINADIMCRKHLSYQLPPSDVCFLLIVF